MSNKIQHKEVSLITIAGMPAIKPGDNLSELIVDAFPNFKNEDVLIVAQKIVSKAEGRFVSLSKVIPSERAVSIAAETGRDARYCQVVLDESKQILEIIGRTIVVEHRSGAVCTSAGIDRSNIDGTEMLLLLPLDADKSAEALRIAIEAKVRKKIAVIINDSGGSAYRKGAIGEAIGLSGIKPINEPTTLDLFGRECSPSINVVDQLSAAATLLMGEAGEGTPVVIVRGYEFERDEQAKLKDILISV